MLSLLDFLYKKKYGLRDKYMLTINFFILLVCLYYSCLLIYFICFVMIKLEKK